MKASPPSTNDWTIAKAWTAISSLRLSDRSARSPAHAPKRSTGPNCAAASRPRARPLSVSSSTSSVCAMRVSQLPIWETSWPEKKSRKLRMRIDRNVSFVARRRRVMVDPRG